MILRPPRSTRTDTRCPYTTLLRSGLGLILNDLIPVLNAIDAAIARADSDVATPMTIARLAADLRATGSIRGTTTVNVVASGKPIPPATQQRLSELNGARSEERRVGKECVNTCRSRGSPYH